MDKNQYLQPRQYEMMVVFLPDQTEEDTQAMIDKMTGYITGQNGTIDSISAESPWGRRRLAYTIRHDGVDYRDGHYVLVYFTTMASAITELERDLKLDTNVIRYLLLQFDEQMGEKIDESAIAGGEEADGETADAEVATSTEDVIEAEAAETTTEEEVETADREEAAVEETVAVEEAPAEEAAAEESVEAPAETEAAEETAEEETEA